MDKEREEEHSSHKSQIQSNPRMGKGKAIYSLSTKQGRKAGNRPGPAWRPAASGGGPAWGPAWAGLEAGGVWRGTGLGAGGVWRGPGLGAGLGRLCLLLPLLVHLDRKSVV